MVPLPKRKEPLTKRKLHIGLTAAIILLLIVTFTVLWKRPPLLLYIQLTTPHRLPARLSGRAFNYLSGRRLPEKTEHLDALFIGGREPFLFIRFKTDSVGIERIIEQFGGQGADVSTLDAAELRSMAASGIAVFPWVSSIEARFGLSVFDQASIRSGRLVEGSDEPRASLVYTILIDDVESTVYMAMQRLSWQDRENIDDCPY